MLIEHFFIQQVNESNTYLIACPDTRRAAIIDAGGFSAELIEFAADRDLQIVALFVTHDHYDHTGGIERYLETFSKCRLYAAGRSVAGMAANALRDGDTIRVGTLEVTCRTIPGHTPDCCVYRVERSRTDRDRDFFNDDVPSIAVVFSGDALFAGSIGGTGGDAARKEEVQGIRRKLFTLPPETVVFPGHGPATTVGVEAKHNPFF